MKKDYIYVGTGISQFINSIVGLNMWDKVLLPEIEFALYRRTALLHEKKLILIKGIHTNDFVNNLKRIKTTDKDLLCISSPRWFDGETFTKKQIKDILNFYNGTLIIDEAYVDYSDDENGMIDICLKNDRVIIFRSFSKKFLASGYRTGYMITKKQIDGLRNTIIPLHSVTSYSENFFVTLLNDEKILNAFTETRNYIKHNRDLIYNSLCNYKNIEIIKSNANFITLVFDDEKIMNKVYENLKDLAGTQKFNDILPFIKIWVNNELFSHEVIKRAKEILQ